MIFFISKVNGFFTLSKPETSGNLRTLSYPHTGKTLSDSCTQTYNRQAFCKQTLQQYQSPDSANFPPGQHSTALESFSPSPRCTLPTETLTPKQEQNDSFALLEHDYLAGYTLHRTGFPLTAFHHQSHSLFPFLHNASPSFLQILRIFFTVPLHLNTYPRQILL